MQTDVHSTTTGDRRVNGSPSCPALTCLSNQEFGPAQIATTKKITVNEYINILNPPLFTLSITTRFNKSTNFKKPATKLFLQ